MATNKSVKRVLSKEARERIAVAQRERWAKYHAASKKEPSKAAKEISGFMSGAISQFDNQIAVFRQRTQTLETLREVLVKLDKIAKAA